jgi:hypothetical protein
MDGAENACENGRLGSGFMRGRLRTDCNLEKIMRPRAVLAINGTSPSQSSNQLSLHRRHFGTSPQSASLGFECRFRFSALQEERHFAHQWATAELRRYVRARRPPVGREM